MSDSWPPPGYVLDRRLAVSPALEVWRAWRQADGAARRLCRHLDAAPPAAAELRRVVALTGALRHPHLPALDDVVTAGADVVVVAADAPGGDLDRVLARRLHLAVPEVVAVLVPVGRALAALAARGVALGEVAPAQVTFAADGRPLLDLAVVPVRDLTAPAPDGGSGALARLGGRLLGPAAGAPVGELLATVAAAAPADRPPPAELVEQLLDRAPAAPPRLPAATAGAVRGATAGAGARASAGTGSGGGDRVGRHRRCDRRRHRAAAVVAAACALSAAVAAGTAWGHRAGPAATVSAVPRRPAPAAGAAAAAGAVPQPPSSWRHLVAGLERRRGEAYLTGRADLLRSLYLPGSRSARADVARLHALTERGLHPRHLRPRLRSVRVLARRAGRVRLEVVDVLPPYDVVDARGRTVSRAAGRPARAVVMTLVHAGGGWRIAAVRAA